MELASCLRSLLVPGATGMLLSLQEVGGGSQCGDLMLRKLQEGRGYLDGLGLQRLLLMAPSPQRGAVTLTRLHFCAEMRYRKPPGGEGWWLGKVSPEKQEVVQRNLVLGSEALSHHMLGGFHSSLLNEIPVVIAEANFSDFQNLLF